MNTLKERISYKTVGKNGQVSLGKEFAGALVEMVELDSGTVMVRRGNFVSDYEKQLLSDGWGERIAKALDALEEKEIGIEFEGEVRDKTSLAATG